MAQLGSVQSSNTFLQWLSHANKAYTRLDQFAVNESALYANTISANTGLNVKGQDSDSRYANTVNLALKQDTATERAALANTNAYIATQAAAIADLQDGYNFTGAVGVAGTLTANGITVDHGDVNISGSGNRAVNITSPTGIASMELNGTTGAFIDINTPHTDDFDIRIGGGATGGTIQTSGGVLAISANTTFSRLVTHSANSTHNDSVRAYFGSDNDAHFRHDDANFYHYNGKGNTLAYSDTFQFFSTTGSETFAQFNHNGAINLYYDNALKFETITTGTKTTGEVYIAGDTATYDDTPNNGLNLYYESDTGLATIGTYSSGGSTGLEVRTNAGAAASVRALYFDGAGRSTFSANAAFGDNIRTNYGAGNDGSIYSDGANFTFASAAEHHYSDAFQWSKGNATETIMTAVADGAVTLYYDNTERAATTATGLDVSGRVAEDQWINATASGNQQPDFSLYKNLFYTLTGNITLQNSFTSTNAVGQTGLIILQQDGTGSRTLSLESYYHTPGNVAPTLSTGANDIDVIPYYVASSTSILLGQLTRDIS